MFDADLLDEYQSDSAHATAVYFEELYSQVVEMYEDPDDDRIGHMTLDAFNKLRYIFTRVSPQQVWAWTVFNGEDVPDMEYVVKTQRGVKTVRVGFYKFISKVNSHLKVFTQADMGLIATYLPVLLLKKGEHRFNFELTDAVSDVYYDNANSIDSCMVDEAGPQMYDRQDAVKIVKIKEGKRVVGRALLWTTVDGVKVLDRVYPSDGGAHTYAVRQWAKAQGFVFKTRDQLFSPLVDGSSHVVEVDYPEEGFPYMDTFKYAYAASTGKVWLSNDVALLMKYINEHEQVAVLLNSQPLRNHIATLLNTGSEDPFKQEKVLLYDGTYALNSDVASVYVQPERGYAQELYRNNEPVYARWDDVYGWRGKSLTQEGLDNAALAYVYNIGVMPNDGNLILSGDRIYHRTWMIKLDDGSFAERRDVWVFLTLDADNNITPQFQRRTNSYPAGFVHPYDAFYAAVWSGLDRYSMNHTERSEVASRFDRIWIGFIALTRTINGDAHRIHEADVERWMTLAERAYDDTPEEENVAF